MPRSDTKPTRAFSDTARSLTTLYSSADNTPVVPNRRGCVAGVEPRGTSGEPPGHGESRARAQRRPGTRKTEDAAAESATQIAPPSVSPLQGYPGLFMRLASVFVSRLTNERYGHLAQNTAHRNPKRKRGTLRVFLAYASGYELSGLLNPTASVPRTAAALARLASPCPGLRSCCPAGLLACFLRLDLVLRDLHQLAAFQG